MIIYIRHYFVIAAALIGLCLPALQPFLQNQMLLTDDGALHLYRIIALDDAIQQTGQLYPRYAPGLVYGYGAPLFNYFSPLAYYPAVLLRHLGLNYTQAWLGAMSFYIILAAGGAYAWGNQWTNRSGGFGSAAAYVYAPYFLFDAVRRGTLTEVAALAALPVVLWAFGRLYAAINHADIPPRSRHSSGWAFLAAALLFALFIPLHNIVTILGLALLLPYCALLWLSAGNKLRTFSALLSAGVLGLAMTTFFWLPALGETGDVKINAIAENLNFVDVTRSLRPLWELFIPTFTADPTQLQQAIPIVVSWLPIVLAFTALLIMMKNLLIMMKKRIAAPTLDTTERGSRGGDTRFWLFWLCCAVAIFMLLLNVDTPLSVWLWQNIPLLSYAQFAWRTLGIASLALAMIAGMGVYLFSSASFAAQPASRPRVWAWAIRFFPSIVLVAFIVYSLPWLVALYAPIPAASIHDSHQHERRTGQLALSSYSEYLPNWVEAPPNPATFWEQYPPASRLLPVEGVAIHEAAWQGTGATISLTSVTPVTLIFDWLYVPGWSARFVNVSSASLPLTVKPVAPHGLVSVEIPAGDHILEIGLQATPLQALANGISGLACGLWLAGLGVWIGSRSAVYQRLPSFIKRTAERTNPLAGVRHASPLSPQAEHLNGANGSSPILIIFIGITLLLVKVLIVDVLPNPFRAERFAAGSITGGGNRLEANFGGEIQLVGVELPKSVKSGNFTNFSAFWRLFSGGITHDYSSIYQLRNDAGFVIAETGSFAPGNRATSAWLPGYYLQETLSLPIPSGTAPGIYTLEAGLYAAATGERLSLINAAGNPENVKIAVGQIEILRPDAPPTPKHTTPINSEISFAALLTPLPQRMTVGDELIFGLQWVAQRTPSRAYHFRLVWQHDTQTFFSKPMPLVADFPTVVWQTGDVWNGHHALIVPGNLAEGGYRVLAQPLDADNNAVGEPIAIGEMMISVPERNFDVPAMSFSSDAVWQNGIRLLGYDIQGRVTGVTLYWQTDALIDQNLRLFVHVVDGETIIAQWDGIPADWKRPTTSWIPDEVITTQHSFEVPEGNYEIRIGWYDAATNARIQLGSTADALIISPAASP